MKSKKANLSRKKALFFSEIFFQTSSQSGERSRIAATEINQLSAASLDTAARAGAMLEKLIPDIQNTAVRVQEISSASDQQAAGVDQINGSIQRLNDVIKNAARVAVSMAGLAENLSSGTQSASRISRVIYSG